MRLSERCIGLIREREGLHTRGADGLVRAYKCPAGRVTIGWGCTKGVQISDVWTPEQCDLRLLAELRDVEQQIARHVKVALTQDQHDALVSFVYNAGGLHCADTGAPTGVLQALNAGRLDLVPGQIMRWVKYTDPKSGKKVDCAGLITRRRYECALWRGLYAELPPDPGPAAKPQMPGAWQTVVEPSEPPPQAIATPDAPVASVAGTGTGKRAAVEGVAGGYLSLEGGLTLWQRIETLGVWKTLSDHPYALVGLLLGLALMLNARTNWTERLKKLALGI